MSRQPTINIEDLPGSEWIMREITAKDLHKTIPFHAELIKTQKKQGGTLVRIAQFPCYIPPIPTEPSKYEKTVFLNEYIKTAKHQKWIRQLTTKRTAIEARKQEDAMTSKPISMEEWNNYVSDFNRLYALYLNGDDDCYEFLEIVQRESRRIANGVWIYINGVATYLPGSYYFYLNYWTSKEGGAIEYIECDRQEFIHFEAMLKSHPQFRGTVHYRCRQDGKSLRHACKVFWIVMLTQTDGWVQSVDKDDVTAIFDSCITNQVANLPLIFQPHTKKELLLLLGIKVGHSNLEKNTNKKMSKAAFSPTRIHKGGALTGIMAGGIGKAIGRTGIIKWDDETGKTKDVNTVLRQEKSMNSMMYYMISTTIDDTDPLCLDSCEKMYKNSDYFKWETDTLKGKKAASTHSKLLFFLKPAWYCLWNRSLGIKCIDEYGQPDIKKAYEFIENMREEALDSDDNLKLLEIMRHYPYVVEEALLPDASHSVMDVATMTAQIKKLAKADRDGFGYMERDGIKYNLPIRYRLEWKNGVRLGEVEEIVDVINGQHYISELPLKRNNVRRVKAHFGSSGWYEPLSDMYCGGTDTIDKDLTELTGKNKASNGATVTFIRPTGFLEKENLLVHWYCHRPSFKEDFYEEMLKADFFYGRKNSMESNKFAIKEYYKDSGCLLFIADKLDIDVTKKISENEYQMLGTTLDSKSRPFLFKKVVDYVAKYSHLIFHKNMLDRGLGVNLKTLTDNDIWAAFMQAYGLATMTTVKERFSSNSVESHGIFSAMKKAFKR